MLKFAVVLRLTTEALVLGYTVIPYLEHQSETVQEVYQPHLHGFDTQKQAETAANSLVGIILTADHLAERRPVSETVTQPVSTPVVPEETGSQTDATGRTLNQTGPTGQSEQALVGPPACRQRTKIGPTVDRSTSAKHRPRGAKGRFLKNTPPAAPAATA